MLNSVEAINLVCMGEEQRCFTRHPSDIGVEIQRLEADKTVSKLQNISCGGLAFRCETCFQKDELVLVRILLPCAPFECTARVAWCSRRQGQFEVGVAFVTDDDAFKARMVEQMCYIEHYRQQQQASGRCLSSDEAAVEWISQNAAAFPSFN